MSTVRHRSVAEAAEFLGVHPQRVHQRIREGSLRAEKIGHQWVVDAADLQRLRGRNAPGRPLSPRSAWALIAAAKASSDPLAARDVAALLPVEPSARSRARARLQDLVAAAAAAYEAGDLSLVSHLLHHALSKRADRALYAASPRDLADLKDDSRLHLSGISIEGSNLSSAGLVEGYVLAEDREQIVNDYLLSPAAPERANVFLHLADLADRDPDMRRERLVQLAGSVLAVAADLAEHDGVREKNEAARTLLAPWGGIARD
ncbi:helix-turn-helix domain-containing protein [Nocardioides dubius]|uniref:helix-turn-helix domain-containing protein n=2 Tax=Nocardioides dubius TaxID=317019 RepID=UPI0039EC2E39